MNKSIEKQSSKAAWDSQQKLLERLKAHLPDENAEILHQRQLQWARFKKLKDRKVVLPKGIMWFCSWDHSKDYQEVTNDEHTLHLWVYDETSFRIYLTIEAQDVLLRGMEK